MSESPPLIIRYQFQWPNGRDVTYDVALDAETLSLKLAESRTGQAPAWTRLDFYQCPNCPLDSSSDPHCPLALSLVDINTHFAEHDSHEQVELKVVTEERTTIKEGSLQQGIGSLMGLIMPCSGCPHSRFFRPMARFHLPFATEQETIYRATSMYLLAQHFSHQTEGRCDTELSGLNEIYQNLHTVNTYFAKRLREASSSDSTINAVVLLDMFTVTLPYVIEESLDELRYLFQHYGA